MKKTVDDIKPGDQLFVKVPSGKGHTAVLHTVRSVDKEERSYPARGVRHFVTFEGVQGRYLAEFLLNMSENAPIVDGTFDFTSYVPEPVVESTTPRVYHHRRNPEIVITEIADGE